MGGIAAALTFFGARVPRTVARNLVAAMLASLRICEYLNGRRSNVKATPIIHSIDTNPGALIVAVYKDNLVGVAEINFERGCPCRNIVAPELGKLYVLERFCGLGIGSQLLREAEEFLRSKGIKEMWLWVLASNQRAIAFYERKNFDWIGNAPFEMETNSYDNKVMLKQFPDERPTSAAPFA